MKKQQKMDNHGVIAEGKLNELIVTETRRPNGRIRRQTDYQFCPTLTEQHTAHLSDINYLIEKYKPDELAAYIAARGALKQEITSHDFASEPDLQGAKNVVYQIRQNFLDLPDEIKNQFSNVTEFCKFIDNPANQEKMIKLGLLNQKQIEKFVEKEPEAKETTMTPPTKEKKD